MSPPWPVRTSARGRPRACRGRFFPLPLRWAFVTDADHVVVTWRRAFPVRRTDVWSQYLIRCAHMRVMTSRELPWRNSAPSFTGTSVWRHFTFPRNKIRLSYPIGVPWYQISMLFGFTSDILEISYDVISFYHRPKRKFLLSSCSCIACHFGIAWDTTTLGEVCMTSFRPLSSVQAERERPPTTQTGPAAFSWP